MYPLTLTMGIIKEKGHKSGLFLKNGGGGGSRTRVQDISD